MIGFSSFSFLCSFLLIAIVTKARVRRMKKEKEAACCTNEIVISFFFSPFLPLSSGSRKEKAYFPPACQSLIWSSSPSSSFF